MTKCNAKLRKGLDSSFLQKTPCCSEAIRPVGNTDQPLESLQLRSLERLHVDLRSSLPQAPLQRQKSRHLPPGWRVYSLSKNSEIAALCWRSSRSKMNPTSAMEVTNQISLGYKCKVGLSKWESRDQWSCDIQVTPGRQVLTQHREQLPMVTTIKIMK